MKLSEKITSHFLFKNADISVLCKVLEQHSCVSVRYKSGEDIFTKEKNENKIGIIEKGKATVLSEDRSAILRNLSEGDAFGVATLFSNQNDFVSNVVAKTPCSVYFITADAIKALFEADKSIMFNYIQFLSQKIQLLNKRISCFTAGSSEDRLYFYLESIKNDKGEIELDVSMTSLCEMLDIGRASLYRAFDKLEACGVIKKEDKKIIFLNN